MRFLVLIKLVLIILVTSEGIATLQKSLFSHTSLSDSRLFLVVKE